VFSKSYKLEALIRMLWQDFVRLYHWQYAKLKCMSCYLFHSLSVSH
jgi:hypothetical protein